MTGHEIYEEAERIALDRGGERWTRWEDLEPAQRVEWEAIAAEAAQKAISDYEAERAETRRRTEVPYA